MSAKTQTDERNQAELDRDFAAVEAAKKPKKKGKEYDVSEPPQKPDTIPVQEPAQSPPPKPNETEDDAPSPAEAAKSLEVISAKVTVTNKPLSPFNPNPEMRRVSTSLSIRDNEGLKKAFRAVTNQDAKARQIVSKKQVYSLQDWLCHDVEKLMPDGEIKRFVRTVLIMEDGYRISCGSEGILSGLYSLTAFFGPAPWFPGLQVSLETGLSDSGRTFYLFDVH